MNVSSQNQPNIVFIICDDLGVNDLGCYGREDHSTPHLDQLAKEGVRFTSSYASQPICSASRAGLLTGLNPAKLRLTTFLPGRANKISQKVLHPEISMNIPLTIKTMPRYFKEVGYKTGFVGKWHVGDEPGPGDHGFDHVYFDSNGKQTQPCATEGGKAEFELTRETMRFIEENKDDPFMVYLGHYTPHIPYSARENLVEKNKDAFEPVYAALIESLDETIGLLLGKLDELGLKDDTIVVFTSDNGGLHVPEGPHVRVTHNTPFRAGKGYTYEGGQRVPTIVRWPEKVPADLVIDQPVNNIDWIPTLLELSGEDGPEGIDGLSFAKGLLGEPIPERKLFWHFPHYTNQGGRPTGVMRDGKWLLIELYDVDEVELYDLSVDESEKVDISLKCPEQLASMRADLEAWREDNKVQYNTQNPHCDEDFFNEIYVDFDPSQFDPIKAEDVDWEKMVHWRKRMNKPSRVPD
jgi:arylsulfatase A